MNMLSSMIMMLGFGGANDYISVEDVNTRIEARIQMILNYHTNLPQHFVNAVRQRAIADADHVSTHQGIMVEHVPGILNSVDQEMGVGCITDSIDIPYDLEEDCPNIFHIRAFQQQDGHSCGFWTLFNARALQSIIDRVPYRVTTQDGEKEKEAVEEQNDGESQYRLDSTNIQTRAWQRKSALPRLPRVFLEPDALVGIAQRGNFNNFYVLIRPVDNDVPSIWLQRFYNRIEETVLQRAGEIEEDIAARQQDLVNLGEEGYGDAVRQMRQGADPDAIRDAVKNEMDAYLNQLSINFTNNYVNQNIPGALHFACNISFNNVGWHWFLISIVKLRDRNPVMIILDSANIAPRGQRMLTPTEHYIRYLYEIFIRPHERQNQN